MSSLLSGSSASIDTQLPTSTTFLNTSSTINKPSDIPPLSSSSIISSEPTKGSSDDVALDVAPSTAQSATTQTPSTTASDLKAEETVGNSPITSARGASLTADGETPIIALPTASSDSSHTSLISLTSILPTTSSIPTPSISTQLSSSTPKFFPQISTVATVSTGAVPTAAPSSQTPSTITISSQTQIQAAASQSSPTRVSPASGTEIGKESPSPTSSKSSSTTPSQVQSSVAQPTDESVQGPQVFSAAAVAPSRIFGFIFGCFTFIYSINTGEQHIINSGAIPSRRKSASKSGHLSPQGAGVSNTPISTPTSTPISTLTSISSSTLDAGALSVPASASSLPPASTPTVPLSDSILSEIPSNTVTDIAPSSTGSFAAFPTGINTLPGDFQESGLPGSQATGQPVADPVGSSSRPSTGAIVGGTVGGIAAAAVIVILLWFWRKKITGERRASSKAYTEKDSSKPMAQRLGVSTTINAVKQNIGEKFAPRNVNMNRGNSQFLEADAAQPRNVAPMRTGEPKIQPQLGENPRDIN
ncbi:hypothetical protein TrVFT333_003793 [Trichoderma virens FT-333]|nr:hypothetical protein TrVFT333_003793 [Trichoderma virens FT-333]